MKRRYLLTISYIGTYFRASAKVSRDADTSTVIGALECAFKSLPNNFHLSYISPITLSSRTDTGVHALQNTAHIDLGHGDSLAIESVKTHLNKFCFTKQLPLRISNVCQVSDDFNARKFAIQRTYLYRVGVRKSHDNVKTNPLIPISEVNHCYFLRSPCFDSATFHQALALFQGIHDFTSFIGKPKQQLSVRTPNRHIISCYALQGKPFMNSLYEPFSDDYEYWDVLVEGRSFNYRQIRLMVTAAIKVAVGHISISDLQRLLELPTPGGVKGGIVPAHGLHLMKVTYKEADLQVIRKSKPPANEHLLLLHVLDELRLNFSQKIG